ncbi:putative ribonuclease H-like domain-containing protein [Tanacetum coccineum]
MNYKPVVVRNQTNGNASTKENINAGQARKKIVHDQEYILLPLLTSDPSLSKSSKDSPDAGFKPSGEEEKMDVEHPENEDSEVPNTEEPRVNQEQDESINSTNNINTVSSTVNTASIEDNVVDENIVYGCIDDPNMPNLEEIVYSDDDEEVGAEADMNNLATTVPVSPIPTTRVHKDHPLEQIIGDIHSAPQTRRMTKSVTEHEEVYVCQPPGFEDPQFPDKVYKVEKDLYGLHQAPRAWCMLMTSSSLCVEFEQMMHKRFQMSSMGELTFFLGLQVKQKDDGIFISQDKYVADILKKFNFATVNTTSTPIETNKALLKDEEAEDFQVTPKVSHLYAVNRIFRYLKGQPKLGLCHPKDSPFDLEDFSDSDYAGASLDRKSTTGGCQFLGKRLISWQCKKQTIVANSTTKAEYVAAANCCGQVLWIQNQMLDYGFNFMNTKIHIDNESTICIVKNLVFHSKTKHIEIRHHFIRDSYEKKLIQVIKIHTDHNVADLLTKAFDVSRKAKRTTEISQSSGPIHLVADETVYKEWEDIMERAATTASSLEAEQDNAQIRFEAASKQSNDPPLSRVNTLGSGEDSMKLMELMELCTKLSERILDNKNRKSDLVRKRNERYSELKNKKRAV